MQEKRIDRIKEFTKSYAINRIAELNNELDISLNIIKEYKNWLYSCRQSIELFIDSNNMKPDKELVAIDKTLTECINKIEELEKTS